MIMIAKSVSLMLALVLLPFASMAYADEKEEDADQKHSAIVEVEGVVMLDENLTIKTIREMAYMQARRKAARSALTHVKSYTKMENFQVTQDLVESYAEARIRVLDDKDIGIQNNRYKVWIRAEVRYDERAKPPALPKVLPAKTKPNPKLGTPANSKGKLKEPLTVRVWTAKREFRKGDKVEIFVTGNRDFYGQLFYEDVNGNIVRLLPNDFRRKHFFKAGETYKVPDEEDRFELTVTPPFGAERLTVYASTKPTADVGGKDVGNGLTLAVRGGVQVNDKQRKENRTKLGVNMRALKVTGANESSEPSDAPTEFFEAVWRIRTRR